MVVLNRYNYVSSTLQRSPWLIDCAVCDQTRNKGSNDIFRPAGANPLLDVDKIRRVYAGKGNWSIEDTNIWCDSVGQLGIYRQKTAMGHYPPKFSESPSSETTGPIKTRYSPIAERPRCRVR